MHKTSIHLEDLTLFDLLTVDTHGGKINIHDENRYYDLIPSRSAFFSANGLYADTEGKSIVLLEDNKTSVSLDLDELLKRLDRSEGSCVVLIEGFAGCGKSTLVQYILSKQLKDYHYDYSFFNYDLEAQNNLLIYDESGKIIKKSSIYEAIKKSFFEQFMNGIKISKTVFDDFSRLLELCRNYQYFKDLYLDFFHTDTYNDMAKYVHEGSEKNEDLISKNLWKQTRTISNSSCLLALDYLFRLAMYKNRMLETLYVCYDNLDAIEDAEDLKSFDDDLAEFSWVIDGFITYLQQENFFSDLPIPHFVIMATYRKITAVMAKISETAYKEVSLDKRTSAEKNEFIFHIDATSAFSYRKIVEKRKQYFEHYFKAVPHLSEAAKEKILHQLTSWNKLNQKLEIMHDRYACLWNKNYRTCSLIANELYEKPSYDFLTCADFIEKSKINDGYSTFEVEDSNNTPGSYYGGSAIILSNVCKVFHAYHIWDDFLHLARLNQTPPNYKNVSFSRIILTYIYNSDAPVSLEELFSFFCKNGLFSSQELCHILSKMLARNTDGVWRRPIYYFNECILSEKAEDIEKHLLRMCRQLAAGKRPRHQYEFVLCDSGEAYVEQLMQEFEFFSNRLNNNNKPLYLYHDIHKIASVINDVYQAVSNCCENMAAFREEYIRRNNATMADYLSLPIHPITNRNSPQLHTERIIFSHIAYLNNVRLYYLGPTVTPDLTERKEYNKLFVDCIKNYLELYKVQIKPVTTKRALVAHRLERIVKRISTAIRQDSPNLTILFQPISLKSP